MNCAAAFVQAALRRSATDGAYDGPARALLRHLSDGCAAILALRQTLAARWARWFNIGSDQPISIRALVLAGRLERESVAGIEFQATPRRNSADFGNVRPPSRLLEQAVAARSIRLEYDLDGSSRVGRP